MTDASARPRDPLGAFNFRIEFLEESLPGSRASAPALAAGFSECTGLEGTMEPKVIKVGGRNDGPAQRVGPVTWATVILKRGLGTDDGLFDWFLSAVRGGALGRRATVVIHVMSAQRVGDGAQVVRTWKLHRALPVKFKTADLNARSGEIAIEELHLAHEGLELERRGST